MKLFGLLLLILAFTVAALNKRIVYEAPYGSGKLEIARRPLEYNEEEMFFIPTFFGVYEEMLVLDDKYNERAKIINLTSKKIESTITGGLEAEYVNLKDSIVIYRNNLYRIKNGNLKFQRTYRDKKDGSSRINFVIEHPSGYKILNAGNDYILDSTYVVIGAHDLPKEIEFVTLGSYSAWFFRDKKAFIGAPPDNLQRLIFSMYAKLTGRKYTGKVDDIYAFPNASESGGYFTNGFSRIFANNDRKFSAYYYSYDCDSVRTHASTFSVSKKYTGGSKKPLTKSVSNYEEDISIICSYDRLGQLRFWFPEPPLEEGWKKAAAPIFVSDEGRIFRMTFYSHMNKSKEQIDTTKGIRIIEYIPEKKDFSHEARVKMYGGKN